MSWIDLHIHTTASDGTETPSRVVELAKERGLPVIAITDHDTMGGVAEAREAGRRLGVEVIGGIEISTDWKGEEVHLLGYFPGSGSSDLEPLMRWNVRSRESRNERIVAALREAGCPISMEALKSAHPGAVLGRPHIAEALVGCGWAESVADAFHRYLSRGCPFYQARPKMPFSEAAEAVSGAGGVPVLAHPLQYRYSREKLEEFVSYGASCGVRGLEVYYTGYDREQRALLKELARKNGLIETGGSDFHGARKPEIQLGTGTGELRVPEEAAARLKQLWPTGPGQPGRNSR